MFGVFTFAYAPFATISEVGLAPIPNIEVKGGYVTKGKKKYKTYTIFGKSYQLTEKEYEAYCLQRDSLQKQLDNKNKEELFDIIEDSVEDDNIVLSDLISNPVFKINHLDIPLFDYKPNDGLMEIAIKQLLEINRQKAITKEKKRIQNLIDDELIIEMLLTNVF